jgi:hypothetical protein
MERKHVIEGVIVFVIVVGALIFMRPAPPTVAPTPKPLTSVQLFYNMLDGRTSLPEGRVQDVPDLRAAMADPARRANALVTGQNDCASMTAGIPYMKLMQDPTISSTDQQILLGAAGWLCPEFDTQSFEPMQVHPYTTPPDTIATP